MAHWILEGERYEVPSNYTLGQLRLLKQITGLTGAKVDEALREGDPDVLAAMFLIAMRRAGKKVEISDLDNIVMTEQIVETDEGKADGQ